MEPRAEEGSAARPLVREPVAAQDDARERDTEAPDDLDNGAPPSGEAALAALERAAENIRPSWHGAEAEVEPSQVAAPAPLPPPPALPSFSSFPIEQPALHYRVDTTVRTAAILPERLSQLLNQPQIADASHWLRRRPLASGALAVVAVFLLAWLLWPSAPEAAPKTAAKPKPAATAPALPVAPAPSAAPEPIAPAAGESEVGAKAPEPEQPLASAKKRDKRKTPGGKATAGKARKPAPTKAPAAPTR